ncbi:hypothetical protein RJ492_001208 [Pluralibacter gergoviae]|uniref:Cyanophage baseplate Pam3 plug gp18 domain-containing protein n=1 Tax=Pluralibacter gergoviae TaxID=61647 RepID=A0AAI9DLR6_PLUGE|nr:hypothetical protein [Pluralibacter gergoviae]EKV9907709.1 hypothetical protein [Pluralibacter gergoviae]EKW7276822.1 hypothetical protein [Pluralibacter gergoviae]ELD4293959.1 hypothetical protein [Pluralibacter gergoviae]ELD4304738.1 hypothetical protein [Pluralibacter gergoviae]
MKIIPLNSGFAYQRFSVQLGNHFLKFRLEWLTRFKYYTVDIYENDQPIVLGRALHPGVNLVAGLNTDIGIISLEGESPTVANLGKSNQLRWYTHE